VEAPAQIFNTEIFRKLFFEDFKISTAVVPGGTPSTLARPLLVQGNSIRFCRVKVTLKLMSTMKRCSMKFATEFQTKRSSEWDSRFLMVCGNLYVKILPERGKNVKTY